MSENKIKMNLVKKAFFVLPPPHQLSSLVVDCGDRRLDPLVIRLQIGGIS